MFDCRLPEVVVSQALSRDCQNIMSKFSSTSDSLAHNAPSVPFRYFGMGAGPSELGKSAREIRKLGKVEMNLKP